MTVFLICMIPLSALLGFLTCALLTGGKEKTTTHQTDDRPSEDNV